MFKYAYVVFPDKDRSLAYIVNVEDIKDLRPRSSEDFDSSKTYEVKWETSNLSKDEPAVYCPGKVKCLGATHEEIEFKRKALNLKKPLVLSLVPPPPDEPEADVELEDSLIDPKEVSRRSASGSRKRGMAALAAAGNGEVGKTGETALKKKREKPEAERTNRDAKPCKEGSKKTGSDRKKKEEKKQREKERKLHEKMKRDAKEVKKREEEEKEKREKDADEKKKKEQIKRDAEKEKKRKEEEKRKRDAEEKKEREEEEERKRDAEEKEKKEEEKRKRDKAMIEKMKLEADERRKKIDAEKKEGGKKRQKTGSEEEESSSDESDERRKKIHAEKKKGGEKRQKKGSEEEESSSDESDDEYIGQNEAQKLKADNELMEKRLKEAYQKIQKLRGAQGMGDDNTTPHEFDDAVDSSNDSSHPGPSDSESNVMGAKGSDDDHSSDEETVINRINDDLKGKCPLRTSRDGNKVYLGSNTWISKKTWEEDLKLQKKDSLFVNDLPSAVWGKKDMKSRSLTGRAGKGKNEEDKTTKATPRKVRLCEAVFRGRLKSQGINDKVQDVLVTNMFNKHMGSAFYETRRVRPNPKKTDAVNP